MGRGLTKFTVVLILGLGLCDYLRNHFVGKGPTSSLPTEGGRPAPFLVCSWQLLFECTCPQGHSSPPVAQSGSILAQTQQFTMHPALIGCRQTVANCDPPRSFGPDTVHIQATLSLKLLELNVSI